jgi:hypothetical protein
MGVENHLHSSSGVREVVLGTVTVWKKDLCLYKILEVNAIYTGPKPLHNLSVFSSASWFVCFLQLFFLVPWPK